MPEAMSDSCSNDDDGPFIGVFDEHGVDRARRHYVIDGTVPEDVLDDKESSLSGSFGGGFVQIDVGHRYLGTGVRVGVCGDDP